MQKPATKAENLPVKRPPGRRKIRAGKTEIEGIRGHVEKENQPATKNGGVSARGVARTQKGRVTRGYSKKFMEA